MGCAFPHQWLIKKLFYSRFYGGNFSIEVPSIPKTLASMGTLNKLHHVCKHTPMFKVVPLDTLPRSSFAAELSSTAAALLLYALSWGSSQPHRGCGSTRVETKMD